MCKAILVGSFFLFFIAVQNGAVMTEGGGGGGRGRVVLGMYIAPYRVDKLGKGRRRRELGKAAGE